MMFRPLLSPDASPNSTKKEAVLSAVELLSPFFWFGKEEARHDRELKRYFSETFGIPYVETFAHGRTALEGVLSALGIGEDDDIFVQAFTCVVVPNSVLVRRARVTYVDVDPTYNMDVSDLERCIQKTKKPRAVIIQHTFGVPADIAAVQAICAKYNLLLIEDCAHSLLAHYRGELVGTFGDAAIFSFGRDKCISGISGGLAIVKTSEHAERLHAFASALPSPSRVWTARHIAHPLIFEMGKCLFRLHSALYTAWITLWKKLNVLPLVVNRAEKNGEALSGMRLPAPLAHRALLQLKDIRSMNAHREAIVAIYERILGPDCMPQRLRDDCSSALLRYSIRLAPDKLKSVRTALRAEGVYLGTWYDTIVAPKDTDLARIGYIPHSCPQAESVTQSIANLPTHRNIMLTQAEQLALRIRSLSESL